MKELDPGKLIIPYCSVGVRSYNAARILMQSGFKRVKVLEGGTTFYKSYHYKKLQDGWKLWIKRCGNETINREKRLLELDCSGLQCPGPIMKVNETLRDMEEGERLCVAATDLGFARDISAWCSRTGNTLAASEKDGKQIRVTIEKRERKKEAGKPPKQAVLSGKTEIPRRNGKEKQLLYLTVIWIRCLPPSLLPTERQPWGGR